MTQQSLAALAGISKPYLSQLEHGRREGSVTVLRALAGALGVDLDDLSPRLPDAPRPTRRKRDKGRRRRR
jgi:transcriptional regulator with XRE-family HTH domain